MKNNEQPGTHSGFVGTGSHFTGNLEAPGPFNVNGGFSGEIRSEDVVSVGAEGRFEGNIHAREVVVEQGGRIVGEIDADRVEVQAGGVIAGVAVRAASLVLDADSNADGARFDIRRDYSRARPGNGAGSGGSPKTSPASGSPGSPANPGASAGR